MYAKKPRAKLTHEHSANLNVGGDDPAAIDAVARDTGRELYALRPDRMKVVPVHEGWPESYEYNVGGRSVRFDQISARVPPILHLTFFHPLDDHYGLAPVEAAAVAVELTFECAALWFVLIHGFWIKDLSAINAMLGATGLLVAYWGFRFGVRLCQRPDTRENVARNRSGQPEYPRHAG